MKRLEAAIRDISIFQEADEQKRTTVLQAMQEMRYGIGETVVVNRDEVDYLYVVESGILDCYQFKDTNNDGTPSCCPVPRMDSTNRFEPASGIDRTEDEGPHQYKPGDMFGELSMMSYDMPVVTIVCASPCTLWALDRSTFRTTLLNATTEAQADDSHSETSSLLPTHDTVAAFVSQLRSVLDVEIEAFVAEGVLKSYEFADGELVIREGDSGREFYIIEVGEAKEFKTISKYMDGEQPGELEEEVTQTYQYGDYFGGMCRYILSHIFIMILA